MFPDACPHFDLFLDLIEGLHMSPSESKKWPLALLSWKYFSASFFCLKKKLLKCLREGFFLFAVSLPACK